MKKILLFGVLVIAAVSLQGCYKSNLGVKKSPPSHAPAYGRRAQDVVFYNYTYYPSYGIYFDPVRNVYFYQSNKSWVTAAKLPHAYRKLGKGVKIKVDNKKPYLKHKEHKSKYAPGQARKKLKGYGAKGNSGNGKGR